MKNYFWQHIRIRANSPGASIRFNVDIEKNYKHGGVPWTLFLNNVFSNTLLT